MRVLISSSSSLCLSKEAILRARELDALWAFPDHCPLVGEPQHYTSESTDPPGKWDHSYFLPDGVPRHDPILLQVFDELGDKMSSDEWGSAQCVEVPDDVTYYIGSYTGEWVAEQHRQWFRDTGINGRPAGDFGVFTKDSKFSPRES